MYLFFFFHNPQLDQSPLQPNAKLHILPGDERILVLHDTDGNVHHAPLHVLRDSHAVVGRRSARAGCCSDDALLVMPRPLLPQPKAVSDCVLVPLTNLHTPCIAVTGAVDGRVDAELQTRLRAATSATVPRLASELTALRPNARLLAAAATVPAPQVAAALVRHLLHGTPSVAGAYHSVLRYDVPKMDAVARMLTDTVGEDRVAFEAALSGGRIEAAADMAWVAMALGQLHRGLHAWLKLQCFTRTQLLAPLPTQTLLLIANPSGADEPLLAAVIDQETGALGAVGLAPVPLPWGAEGPTVPWPLAPLSGPNAAVFASALSAAPGMAQWNCGHVTLSAGPPPALEAAIAASKPNGAGELWQVLDTDLFALLPVDVREELQQRKGVRVHGRRLNPSGILQLDLGGGTWVSASSEPVVSVDLQRTGGVWLARPAAAAPPKSMVQSDAALARSLRGAWAVYNSDGRTKKAPSFAYCMVLDSDAEGRIFGMDCPWSHGSRWEQNPFLFRLVLGGRGGRRG